MSIDTEPCDSHVTIAVTGALAHRCPYRDEDDRGTAEVTWVTDGRTVELHSLAGLLGSFRDEQVSHEDVTDRIATALDVPGVADVRVVTRWVTAHLEVRVGAVPRQRLIAEGA